MTSKKQFKQTVRLDVEARNQEGLETVLEDVLQEEMTEHLGAGYGSLPSPGVASSERPLHP